MQQLKILQERERHKTWAITFTELVIKHLNLLQTPEKMFNQLDSLIHWTMNSQTSEISIFCAALL